MTDKQMPTIVRPAKPGSKKDWATVSGEIPPELAERWQALLARRGAYQTDLVREAVELLLRAEERKGRRQSSGRRVTDVVDPAA